MRNAAYWMIAVQLTLIVSPLVTAGRAPADEESREPIEFFEQSVRPILEAHCIKCHGPEKQESDLRLDSLPAAITGGISGSALVPGKPQESLLIKAIRHEGDTKMPPKEKLSDRQVEALIHWVELGAPWPNAQPTKSLIEERAKNHWAFQPVADPAVPQVYGNASSNPIDAFIAEKFAGSSLVFSPPADRRTLLRRLTYDLTGLPPTIAEVEQFTAAENLDIAYEQAVDRLLESPQYGEHWARKWLDIARYSDTKGYVYAREQRQWLHAWVYRDWVARALQSDMPYNRFLLLQIAADQAEPENTSALAAMGYLTLGRRFLGVTRDIIDDRIDVVTRGTMGLTVGCARCHDHKYDPIPTRDYYSLYGVFQSCSEQLVELNDGVPAGQPNDAFQKEFATRVAKLNDTLQKRREETAARVRDRAGEYLAAQFELSKYPEEGFDQVFAKSDMLPAFVRQWQTYLSQPGVRNRAIFKPWIAFASIAAEDFVAQAANTTTELSKLPVDQINSLVAAKFSMPPASKQDVAARYGELFRDVESQWQTILKTAAEKQQPLPTMLPDPAAEALRQVLYESGGPCVVPNEPIVNIENYLDSDTVNELWKLQNEVDGWVLNASPAPKFAAVLHDRAVPITPRVFKRGNPANKGEEVPRQFLSVLAGPQRAAFAKGSGRLELAQAIIDPANPLTPRVAVNRVWAQHFGAGLVRTPSDFGTRAERPSHPALLDWLTKRFIEDGWSYKKLHRRILLSQAYRQSSRGPNEEQLLQQAVQVDPENRLLWRMNDKRLTFEEMHDSLQSAAGTLDLTVGGKAADIFSAGFRRRALYGFIDRQFFPSTLRIFDFANPDLHIPQRSDTTVPQQALFFLNHPLILRQSQALAAATATKPGEERVRMLFERVYQRGPTAQELAAALQLVEAAAQETAAPLPATAADWHYGTGGFDAATGNTTDFKPLPHFTGSAWQGGAAYPDATLGWAQLTATGGHPGNDSQHAVIRRWRAPREMTISIKSVLQHEPTQGQGVRGFISHNRTGKLAEAQVHTSQAELNIDTVAVQAGDTIDFVADIGASLSYNQFLWKISITSTDAMTTTWNSANDFHGPATTLANPWEQLAQVLLSANEFLFID